MRPGGRVRSRRRRGAAGRPLRRRAHRARGRAARAVGRSRRPVRPEHRVRGAARGASGGVGAGLGGGRRRDRRRSGRAGRGALRRGGADRRSPGGQQPLVDRREGPHGRRLQGPRLLGHRHLPAPVLRRREARHRAPDRRVPRPHPRRRPPERRERGPARRVVRLGERRLGRGRHAVVRDRAGRPPAGGAHGAPGDPRRGRRRLGDRDVRPHVRRPRPSSTPAAARSPPRPPASS